MKRTSALVLVLVASCGFLRPEPHRHHRRHGPGSPASTAATAPPERVMFVKMISWAEPAPPSCDTDLEGSAPPAKFALRYTDGGSTVAVENDPEKLFGAGWSAVTRSARGLGFEKAGEFTALDFDVVEELRCACGESWRQTALAEVKLAWRAGSAPSVRARFRDGDRVEEIRPVTMNGRLPMYEFRFALPYPDGRRGACASRFLVALELDRPID